MQSRVGQGEAAIYLAADITALQLEEHFIDIIEDSESIEWNEIHQRVEAKQTTCIGKITLQQTLVSTKDTEAVHKCLLQAIKSNGLECLNWSVDAESFKQRVQFINHYINNDPAVRKQLMNKGLPDFSEKVLIESLSAWLQPHLTTENSIKQCQKLNLYTLLKSQLSWEQQQWIKELAPEKIIVPSGSAIRIDYADPSQPVLAVRLQEVFGLYDTPTILNGHCKLMMHLLSPAHRPMQVTQDLNSFWKTTYYQVKKELRGKYKRHYWPDDPFTAQATNKTKKNMNR